MKAFKPDGSRWFAPTALEVMTCWLAQPDLQGWLERTVVFRLGDAVGVVEALDETQREIAALAESAALQIAVFGRPLPRWAPRLRVPRLNLRRGRR